MSDIWDVHVGVPALDLQRVPVEVHVSRGKCPLRTICVSECCPAAMHRSTPWWVSWTWKGSSLSLSAWFWCTQELITAADSLQFRCCCYADCNRWLLDTVRCLIWSCMQRYRAMGYRVAESGSLCSVASLQRFCAGVWKISTCMFSSTRARRPSCTAQHVATQDYQ